jgi:two-component system sensor histidine kinase UhpB
VSTISVSPERELPGRAGETSRRAPGMAARALRTAWYGRSLRAQLLITLVLIGFIAALFTGAVTILQARKSTGIEIAASTRLAEAFVRETIRLMPQDVPPDRFLTALPLQLRLPRHVRISVKDAAGQAIVSRGVNGSDREESHAPAPAWFAALIGSTAETREVPIVVKGERIGTVLLVSEPRDEIGEVWENTAALASVAVPLGLVVIGFIYVLFGRVLDPLTALAGGLTDLEQRNYKVRLARPGPQELAAITERFNALAQALDAARDENARLTRRLITAQDDERRRMALDLHDEVGPSLFGLKAAATSIATVTREPAAASHVHARVREMLAIIDHLQVLNRSLLNRLRPMALGHIPVAELVTRLVRERAQQNPQIAITFSAGQLRHRYGDSVDLTIYRCTQEALTNAIRHAEARSVTVTLGETTEDAAHHLLLTVEDDGRGLAPGAPAGFGISGMRERVQALGGRFVLERAAAGGLRVRIAIPPTPAGPAGDASAPT